MRKPTCHADSENSARLLTKVVTTQLSLRDIAVNVLGLVVLSPPLSTT